jgi:hypothetical protein
MQSKHCELPLSKRRSAIILPVAVLLASFAGGTQASAQKTGGSTIPTLPPPQPGYVVPAHQTLTYTVDWRVFTAGLAVFQLDQQGTVEKVTATADSVGGVTMLFPVVDRFQAGFDTKTGCSTGFSKQIELQLRAGQTDPDRA